MLLPYDPLLTLQIGGRRLGARFGTLLVVVVGCAGATVVALDGRSRWVSGAVVSLLVLAALAGHVWARFWVGSRLGWPARRAHLAVFGGVVDGPDDVPSPRIDALIGLAGLAALAVLAGAAGLADLALGGARAAVHEPAHGLAVMLAALLVVQVMPGLSLDGGRVFRGLVWYLTDSPATGARAAAVYAHVIAAGLIVFGAVAFAFDGPLPFWGLWALVGGWQLSGEARAAVVRLHWLRLARRATLGEVAQPPLSLPGSATIDDALDPLLAAGGDAPFLVGGDDGRPIGVLRLTNLRRCPRAEWDRRAVRDIVTPLDALPRLSADRPALDALAVLDELELRRPPGPGGAVVLVERDGQPVAALDRRRVVLQVLGQARADERR